MHDAMKAYHESWERELDRQFLKNDRYRKRAFLKNMKKAAKIAALRAAGAGREAGPR